MPRTHESSLLTPRNLVLCAMIAFAVGYRLLVHFSAGALPWNFTPVEAMALFGGAYFADKRLAVLVPLAAMALSDIVIGFDGTMSLVVYACIAATAFAGFGLRRRVRIPNVALAAIASATGFYLVTNFLVWLTGTMYAHSFAGLVECYVAGWPFYQYGSLPGTVLWSALLFGGFVLLSRRYAGLRLAAA
ncbi:MAG TPA: DUF6580 family putative transport protein [Rhodanobacteraceae bacterium]|nr:DUF6580 family putative transport protein [Rhodanobacteraceae bacterium]